MYYEIFAKLMKETGLSISETARQIDIPPSTITDWRAGRTTPKADKLLKIANFYGVSIEYLLTGAETANKGLLDDERKILSYYKKLNATGKKEALERISELAELTKYTEKREKSSTSKIG